MPFYAPLPLGTRFRTTLHAFTQDDGLPFAQALSEEQIAQAADDEQATFADDPDCVYTPAVTLWAFLSQVLSGCKSCVAAVARVMVLRIALAQAPCSANTGAYCKARAKLPEAFLRRLTDAVGEGVEDQAPACWRWHDRRVLLADGCEITLPDTPANQQVYPQPGSQKPGLGFPMIRLVVLLTFATASVVGAAFGPHQGKETGETALFRQLLDRLRAGDVVVADRYYCSYWMVALVQPLGVDVAFRLHQRRHYDFRRGKRLGPGDHVVVWTKPARPAWMDAETYARLPQELTIREVRFRVTQPGYRSKEIIVATTLCDAGSYGRDDIADLYHQRWHVELDIRAIKQTLRMDQLSCKAPAMVRRELWAHLLGYNLVRKVMAQAAWARGLSPRQISFAGAVQIVEAFRWLLLCSRAEVRGAVYTAVFVAIATHEVGDRPGRCEPRCVKRRPKEYARLTKPRAEARAELLRP
jgi:Transposase DDE domain